MNDIEAIKVLEELQDANRLFADLHDAKAIRLAPALSHAIAALKARSDAEVVVEWAAKHRGSIIKVKPDNGGWMALSVDGFANTHRAPTLSDLAKNLKG